MEKVHKVAGLKISRVAPKASRHAALPELAPPEERLRTARTHIFSADALSMSRAITMEDVFETTPHDKNEDVVPRLTVYALNMTIMVFTLPVGLALLLMNILGGENLRTTAHVMALTGLFSALAVANPGVSFLPI